MGEVLRRIKNGKFLGFYLRFYEGGRRRVLASRQPSFLEAKRMLVELEARIARGELAIPERRSRWPCVSELVERFLAEYSRPRLKDIERYRSHARTVLKRVIPVIGKLSAGQITQSDVARVRDALHRSHSPGSVRSSLNRLSVVFSWAVRQGLAPTNPCRGVERPRAEYALDFLSSEEISRLIEGAEARGSTLRERMRHVGIALAVYTGLRKGELLGLRWIDLDLETHRLTVARSYKGTPKSGQARHLRLPTVLVPILTEWRSLCPPAQEGSVLPIGRDESRAAGKETMLGLRPLMRELGLREVRHPWHLLRHSFASHFVMAGGNLLALQRILGHSDVKMTMAYAHLAPDFLGREMERVRFGKQLVKP